MGFKGTVVTDFSDHAEYMNGGQMLRAGGDIWMNMMSPINGETESAFLSEKALRETAKHIIYTYLNARVTNMNYAEKNRKYGYIKTDDYKADESGSEDQRYFYVLAAVLIHLMAYALWKDVKKRKNFKKQKAIIMKKKKQKSLRKRKNKNV